MVRTLVAMASNLLAMASNLSQGITKLVQPAATITGACPRSGMCPPKDSCVQIKAGMQSILFHFNISQFEQHPQLLNETL